MEDRTSHQTVKKTYVPLLGRDSETTWEAVLMVIASSKETEVTVHKTQWLLGGVVLPGMAHCQVNFP